MTSHSPAGFTSSAGIAANKLLAKISSALNKPNQQTIVPPRYLPCLRTPLHAHLSHYLRCQLMCNPQNERCEGGMCKIDTEWLTAVPCVSTGAALDNLDGDCHYAGQLTD